MTNRPAQDTWLNSGAALFQAQSLHLIFGPKHGSVARQMHVGGLAWERDEQCKDIDGLPRKFQALEAAMVVESVVLVQLGDLFAHSAYSDDFLPIRETQEATWSVVTHFFRLLSSETCSFSERVLKHDRMFPMALWIACHPDADIAKAGQQFIWSQGKHVLGRFAWAYVQANPGGSTGGLSLMQSQLEIQMQAVEAWHGRVTRRAVAGCNRPELEQFSAAFAVLRRKDRREHRKGRATLNLTNTQSL
jgi:hypothetical protein